jgi:hypothetical protein
MTGRTFAHGLAMLVALAALASGIAGLASGVPAALGVFCLVIGIIVGTMVPLSLRGSRAAWSLIVSILTVWTIGTFFGAASLSKALHIGLVAALIVPLVLATGVVAFVAIRGDYPDD